MIENLHVWSTLILLFVGFPVQLLFVVLYATRKWRKYTFSRALMWKSGSLALYLWASLCKVVVAGLRNYDWPTFIDVQTTIINVVVFWAVANQLRALIVEMAAGDPNAAETEVNDQVLDN